MLVSHDATISGSLKPTYGALCVDLGDDHVGHGHLRRRGKAAQSPPSAQLGFPPVFVGSGGGHLDLGSARRRHLDGDLSESRGAVRLPQQTEGGHASDGSSRVPPSACRGASKPTGPANAETPKVVAWGSAHHRLLPGHPATSASRQSRGLKAQSGESPTRGRCARGSIPPDCRTRQNAGCVARLDRVITRDWRGAGHG